jgi:uncharacterized protein (DUF305 family)
MRLPRVFCLCAARLLAALLVVAGVSCGTARHGAAPPIVQPGAPGEPSRVISPEAATDLPQVRHTAADVRFMQGMIPHHAQALEMAALVPSRSGRDDVRLLARRIALSQADEMRMMQRWLEVRDEPGPAPHAHHAGGLAAMRGMASAEEMRRLAGASGEAFDRLFLELMIRHHEGALTMVRELFAAGGGQEPELFAFASEIESDQAVEIARMRGMLAR